MTQNPKLIPFLTSGWRLIGAALLCGILMGLGQAPVGFAYGILLALPAIGWLFANTTGWWHAARLGWLVGVGYFAPTLFWIVEPFFVEPEVYGWLAPFALILLAGGLSLFWTLGFALARLIDAPTPLRLLALIVTWSLAEYLRSQIFTGFPWALIAYVWAETPLFQLLAYVGPHGLGVITLTLGFLPLMITRPAGVVRFGWMALLLGLLWVGGAARIPDQVAYDPDAPNVRMLQPNAPQHLKWHPDHISTFYYRALDQSGAFGEAHRDMVIWPETSIPFLLGNNTEALQAIADAAGPQTQVVAGIQRREDYRAYNTAIYMDAAGGILDIYDKHHLVPFGEYIPFGWFLGRFGLRGMAAEDGAGFAAGPGPQIIAGKDVPDFAVLICYEAIFSEELTFGGERPGWLLHLTNDAWFGSLQGPYQHLVQARARAIEQGLPLARSANTGISAMIGPHGRVLDSLPLNTAGYLDARLPDAIDQPPYARFRDWPFLVVMAALSLVLIAGHILRPGGNSPA